MTENKLNPPLNMQRIVVLLALFFLVASVGFILEFNYLKKRNISQANIAGEITAQNLESILVKDLNINHFNIALNWLNNNDYVTTACVYNSSKLLEHVVSNGNSDSINCPTQITDI